MITLIIFCINIIKTPTNEVFYYSPILSAISSRCFLISAMFLSPLNSICTPKTSVIIPCVIKSSPSTSIS
nr:MAG TPA: hypothetical protein [Caudoviricetes sp.]